MLISESITEIERNNPKGIPGGAWKGSGDSKRKDKEVKYEANY